MSRKPKDFDLWLETARTVKPLRHRASRPPPVLNMAKPMAESKLPLVAPSAVHVHAPRSEERRVGKECVP